MYVPQEFGDKYWLCTCGKVNNLKSILCNRCSRYKDKQFEIIDEQYLEKSLQQFLDNLVKEEEREMLLKKEQFEKSQEQSRKTLKKAKIIAVVIFIGLLVSTAGYFTEWRFSAAGHELWKLSYPDNNGDTALLRAIKAGDTDEAKRLIELGVRLDKSNRKGYTALSLAPSELLGSLEDYGVSGTATRNVCVEIQDRAMWIGGYYKPLKKCVNYEITYKDGVAVDDVYTMYSEEGNKIYEGGLKHDKPNGYGKLWSDREIYYNGKHYSMVGDILYDGYWKDGIWHGKGKSYWESGPYSINTVFMDTTYKDGYENGKYTRYYENGKLNDRGEIVQGEIVYSDK